jgi:hypothetical protein
LWRGKLKGEKKDHLEELGVDGRIILKMDFKGIGWEGGEWIKPA